MYSLAIAHDIWSDHLRLHQEINTTLTQLTQDKENELPRMGFKLTIVCVLDRCSTNVELQLS